MIKKFIALFFVSFSFVHSLIALSYAEIENKVKKIPIEEQELLTDFFRLLFSEFHCGYVFFGEEKPMSFDRRFTQVNWELFMNFPSVSNSKLSKLWNVWEKWEKEFPSQEFCLKKIEYQDEEERWIEEYLIMDLAKCRQVIENNIEFFGKNLNPNDWIDLIKKNGLSHLKNHVSIGILLGYDLSNAFLFQKLDNLLRESLIPNIKNEKRMSDNITDLMSRFSFSLEELFSSNTINSTSIPIYRVNLNYGSTFDKIHKYKKESAQISKIYNDPNFLTIVLHKLCS